MKIGLFNNHSKNFPQIGDNDIGWYFLVFDLHLFMNRDNICPLWEGM